MEDLPQYISITFIAVVLASLGFLFYALHRAVSNDKDFTPTMVITFIVVWLFILSTMTFSGFFEDFKSRPPRLFLIILPSLIAILIVTINKNTRAYLLRMPLTTLTYIHIVRVPVEIVLWWLAQNQLVPVALTFEGSNYDILSGLSAPFAGLFFVGLRSKSRIGALVWNVICLILLFNVVIRAIIATPYFYNSEVFEVPNLAVFVFPFVLLPGFVVPVVLFSHVVSMINLLRPHEEEEEIYEEHA